MANKAKPLTELAKDIAWLIEHGRGNEDSVLYMPKVEAQRRKSNFEGRVRIQFYIDPIGYSEWNEARDYWITNSGDNPIIAYKNMWKVLKAVSVETIRAMSEDEQPIKESLGDA